LLTLIPLACVLPLSAAALLGILRAVVSRLLSDTLAIALSATTTTLLGILTLAAYRHGTLVYWFGAWQPAHGVALGIDFVVSPFSGAVATLAALLTTAAFVFAWRYFNALGALFPTLMLVFLSAMVCYALSGDLFTLFVFFELMSTTAYALTGYKIEADSLEGALSFAVVNSFGALLFLWGIALLYGRFGALNMAQLGVALSHAGPPSLLTATAFALLTTGFLVKAAGVPFHFWHAEADAVAPAPVCVLISSIMAPLGLVGLGRVYWTIFAGSFPARGGVWDVLLGIGAATAVIGAIMAARQRHLKRLLAFSTIAHGGMMLAGLALCSPEGVGGMLAYMLGHGLVKAALFLCAGIVLHRLGSVDIPSLYGRGRQIPGPRTWLTFCWFVLGGLGLAGIPPFATFNGKALMEAGAAQDAPWLPYVFALASGLTGGAVLRAAARIFLGWGTAPERDDTTTPTADDGPETLGSGDETPGTMLAAPGILLVLSATIGLVPQLSVFTANAAARFLDTRAYRALVLTGHAAATPSPAAARPFSGIDANAFIFMAASFTVMLAFVLASLFGDRVADRLRRPGTLALRPLAWLERLHSADLRDYLAWTILGNALLAASFAAILLG
jgi:multicomponent Na+:H+ antiporter subunit D